MKDKIIQIVQTAAAGIFGLSSSGKLYELKYRPPGRQGAEWRWRVASLDDSALSLPDPPTQAAAAKALPTPGVTVAK